MTESKNPAASPIKKTRKKVAVSGINVAGGRGEIRTHDELAPIPHFECGRLNHSRTLPDKIISFLAKIFNPALKKEKPLRG